MIKESPDKIQMQVNRMYQGSREDILDGIKNDGIKEGKTFLVLNAIVSGMMFQERSPEFLEGLLMAKDNHKSLLGWRISDVAQAALEVCGVEKYQGDEKLVKDLIACKFEVLI